MSLKTLRAVSLIYGMVDAPPPFVINIYSRLSTHVPVAKEFWIQGRRGPLKLRLLTPRGLPNAPIIVLVHGFVAEGPQDRVMARLAEGLCRSGLRVVMPYIETEQRFVMDHSAVEAVDDAIHWSATASGEKISLFGISYSGGLAITAATAPGYADEVKMVFCLSGYNSIDRTGRYYLHDPIRGPDLREYKGFAPFGTLTGMALQYIGELVPAADAPVLAMYLRARLERVGVPSLDRLTPEQRALLDDVLNVRTETMRGRYHSVLERHRAELAAISPAGKVSAVRASLYVLHGVVDPIIPSEEAEWTRFEARNKTNARFLITPVMHHAALAPHAPFLQKMETVYFVSQMLGEALARAPLPDTQRSSAYLP